MELYGQKYIENHPIEEKPEKQNGFSVDVDEIFLDPYICLYYAYEIVSTYGSDGEYYGMDAERIASEIYAHAVLYYAGIYLRDNRQAVIESPTYNSDTSLPATISFSSVASILDDRLCQTSDYLIQHGRNIYVNNDEHWYRLLVYDFFWSRSTTSWGKNLAKFQFNEDRRNNSPRGPVKPMIQ